MAEMNEQREKTHRHALTVSQNGYDDSGVLGPDGHEIKKKIVVRWSSSRAKILKHTQNKSLERDSTDLEA